MKHLKFTSLFQVNPVVNKILMQIFANHFSRITTKSVKLIL